MTFLETYCDKLKKNNCTKCNLGKGPNKTICIYRGNTNAKIMIVGMGPGKDEQRLGEPFVGPAGVLANRMVSAMGLNHNDDIFWTNIVLHRTMNGDLYVDRDPTREEWIKCQNHFDSMLFGLKPEVIIAFGKPTLERLLDIEIKGWLTKYVGNEFSYKGFPVFAMAHPAYILRNESYKPTAVNICKIFVDKYKHLC